MVSSAVGAVVGWNPGLELADNADSDIVGAMLGPSVASEPLETATAAKVWPNTVGAMDTTVKSRDPAEGIRVIGVVVGALV